VFDGRTLRADEEAPRDGRPRVGGQAPGQRVEGLDAVGRDAGEIFPEEGLEGGVAPPVEELERVGGDVGVVPGLLHRVDRAELAGRMCMSRVSVWTLKKGPVSE
jgi:hypothetical protein